MPRKVQKKKAPVKQKQSQRQSQNVVVNVVMAKHRARTKPSGKKATPIIYQPPIRMIQSYGDVLARDPPKPSLLGEEIKQILEQYKKQQPVAELREDFLSRVESKPKERLIPKYDFESGFSEPDIDMGDVQVKTFPPEQDRGVFEPLYGGVSIGELLVGNYGFTASGNKRKKPTKSQELAIKKYMSE